MIDRASAQPLYLQLADLLRDWIESGKIGPGDRIPSEMELAETYGISRMTVRRSIDTLVMEGVLFRQPGKGTFVAQPKMVYRPATIFSFSSAIRELGLAVTTKVLELCIVPAPANVARGLQLTARQQVLFVKRLRYVEGQPMAIHASYLPASHFSPMVNKDLSVRPLSEVMEEVCGLRIEMSRDYVESSLARPDEAELLGIRCGAPVLLITGTAYTADRLPIRYTKSVYRGDQFRFFVGTDSATALEIRAPSQAQQWLGRNSQEIMSP